MARTIIFQEGDEKPWKTFSLQIQKSQNKLGAGKLRRKENVCRLAFSNRDVY